MAARNDITGDAIATKATTDAYRDNWDAIFGKKHPPRVTPEMEKSLEDAKATLEEVQSSRIAREAKLKDMIDKFDPELHGGELMVNDGPPEWWIKAALEARQKGAGPLAGGPKLAAWEAVLDQREAELKSK